MALKQARRLQPVRPVLCIHTNTLALIGDAVDENFSSPRCFEKKNPEARVSFVRFTICLAFRQKCEIKLVFALNFVSQRCASNNLPNLQH